jgi:hypothetical protein
MKKISVVFAFCCSLLCTPASAKTFVGVLWPMFGPLPAIGLVELVAELKMLPDVEVSTYLHQNWPSLVDDIQHQPPGTRIVVVGYSLGANASVFVANKTKYVDVIIALQPSMLSWNPAVTGQVGRYIEVYNPNPWMTFGGMGSKKLIGPNIEYIENNDSHPGAQFNLDFRNLVRSEIARVSAEPAVVTAQARIPSAPQPNDADGLTKLAAAAVKQAGPPSSRAPTKVAAVKPEPQPAPSHDAVRLAAAKEPHEPSNSGGPAKPAAVKQQLPAHQFETMAALLESLTGTVDSGSLELGNLLTQRQLTIADMVDYANRNYGTSRTAEVVPAGYEYR